MEAISWWTLAPLVAARIIIEDAVAPEACGGRLSKDWEAVTDSPERK